MAKTKFCQGISDISDSYMGFILDQWGVLHNGIKAYDGVVDCLKELKARKKTVIILSNSGKRAAENKERLKKMGIGPSLYNYIVTSGEMTWNGLHDQNDDIFTSLGKRCFLFSRQQDISIIRDSGVEVVNDIEQADFLLISGTDAPQKTMADYEAVLRAGVRRRLRAICANPDSQALIGTNFVMGPGLIARRYEEFGGVVTYIGKPHRPIFQHCIQLLQKHDVYPGQTVVVGDTMAHDIIGGYAMGMDTCLVKCGIHSGHFKNVTTPVEVDHALNILIHQYNQIKPTYLVSRMIWGRQLPDRKHKRRKPLSERKKPGPRRKTAAGPASPATDDE